MLASALRRRRAHADDRGAAAVEMALVLPLLILLVFGIIQFSIVYNRVQGLHAAAREGARAASLPTTTSGDVTTRVNSALQGVLPAGAPRTVSVSPGGSKPCQGRSGQSVTVTVQSDYALDIPLFGSRALTLKGRGEFRCE